jgi:hypothetical protein
MAHAALPSLLIAIVKIVKSLRYSLISTAKNTTVPRQRYSSCGTAKIRLHTFETF